MAMFSFKSGESTHKYMSSGIKHVCETFKRRAPGTKSERDAQEYFRDELKKYSDKVVMEDFTLHPGAFMGFIIIASILLLVSIGLYWLVPFETAINNGIANAYMSVNDISLHAYYTSADAAVYQAAVSSAQNVFWNIVILLPAVFTLLGVLMFVFEFLMYRNFVDFLFKKKVSRNVFAVRKPSGEVKRRIIFGGHADAANEWTYSYRGGIAALGAVMFGAIGGLIFSFAATVIRYIDFLSADYLYYISESTGWKAVGIVLLCLVPFAVAILFFINYKIVVDGANDNLSACYIAMGVLKEMADNDFRFENTEVCCLITGAEEAGLRGAKAFAKTHKQELSDVETIAITMDTMREVDQLQVYTRGCTGTVKDDDAVGDLLHEAGLKCDIDMPVAGIYPGAVDAEGFSMYGMRACGFCGVNHNPKRYYHTREDTWTNISEECINLSLDVCLEAARLYDEKGGMEYFDGKRKK